MGTGGENLLAHLDADQLAAVTSTASPLCILAGAGSGKTRVLSRRIAHRSAQGTLDPRHTLALTFTTRAASELRGRIEASGERDLPTTGTFHAVAYAQLRSWWASQNRGEPALLDRRGRLVARLLPEGFPLRVAGVVAEIDQATARGIGPDAYAADVAASGRRLRVPPEQIADIYRAFIVEKRRRNVVDFDDLLVLCARAMHDDPDFAASQRWRFRHLFVDEFQDVNTLQFALLRAWLGERDDLCVVGDPNQAIYGWNGADATYLRNFTEHFPGATVIELATNHRSAPMVVRLADAVLASTSDGRPGPPIRRTVSREALPAWRPRITACSDDHHEAVTVARAVRDAHLPGTRWSHQAILTRTNAQARQIAAVLETAGIPHHLRDTRSLTDHPLVKDLLVRASRSREALRPWIIDQRALLDSASPTARSIDDEEHLTALFASTDRLLAEQPDALAAELPGWIATRDREGLDTPGGRDLVTLTSFHGAKGLEWHTVHLAGMEEGFVPSGLAVTPDALAEEQRLLYVAITRAQVALHVTWARTRMRGDRPQTRRPSRWLGIIERLADQPVTARDPAAPRPDSPGSLSEVSHPGRDAPIDPDRALRAALEEWRTRRARASDVSPDVVLPGIVIGRILEARPRTIEDLESIEGMGIMKARTYGSAILDLVEVSAPTLPRESR